MSDKDKIVLVVLATMAAVGLLWLHEMQRAMDEAAMREKIMGGKVDFYDASSPEDKKRRIEYEKLKGRLREIAR